MKFYLRHYRPCAVASYPTVDMTHSSSPFLLAFNGRDDKTCEVNVSRVATRFFSKLGLNITTTALRALVETLAEQMQMQNQLSAQDREGISNVNGHGHAITRNHYLLRNRENDAAASEVMFAQILPQDVALPTVSAMITEADDKHICFGEQHPQGHTTGDRIPWSHAEKEYLRNWKLINILSDNDNKRALSRCLADIYQDVEAQQIFHLHHVQSTQRLRFGYEACNK